MSVAKSTNHLSSDAPSSHTGYRYGVISWLLFSIIVFVNVGFLVTQVAINRVRDGSLSVAQLDAWAYPGVYWDIASASMLLMLLSGLFLGLTLALLVVRAWMHQTPCRFYGVMLGLQVLPWLYFFVALRF